ncbi:MAG: hypothetical protein JW932_17905 [Deltaproteobacteria bacterium]|nr:hypothetical protein [Deltaproteobacteria bacterium]
MPSRFKKRRRGSHATTDGESRQIQSTAIPIAANVFELRLMADACHRSGAAYFRHNPLFGLCQAGETGKGG